MIDIKEIKKIISYIEVLMVNGYLNKAYNELLDLKALIPDSFIAQYYECKLLSLKNDYYEAVKVANKLIKKYGGNKDLLYLISDIYLKMDDLDSAVKYINLYKEVAPFDFYVEVLEKRCDELKINIIKGDTQKTSFNEEDIQKREFVKSFSSQEDKNENTSELELFCSAFEAVEDPSVVKKSLKEFLNEPILKEETANLKKEELQEILKNEEDNSKNDNEDENLIPLEEAGFIEKDDNVEDKYSQNLGGDIEEKQKLRDELSKHNLLDEKDENNVNEKEVESSLNIEDGFIDMEIKAKDYLKQKDYSGALDCYTKLYKQKKSEHYLNNIQILKKVILQREKTQNLNNISEKYNYLRENQNV